MLVLEVEAEVVDVLYQDGLLLHEKISVLCHALIGLLLLPCLSSVHHSQPLQVHILEVLVGLLEVEELGLNVEACHVYDI